MLQWLRDNLKSLSWTLWLVIAAFIVFYIPDFLSPGGNVPGSALAAVGEETVSVEEFRRAYGMMEDNYRQMFGERFNADIAQQLRLPQQALEQVVARKILVSEAKRLGLVVTNRELQRAILDAGFVDESGRFMGDAAYARVVRRMGYASPAEFEEGLRGDLLVRKLQAVMAHNLYIPDSEVERAYREQVERASLRYVVLPAGRLGQELSVSDDELAAYYETHREEYRQPEKRVASYLLVDQFRLRSGIEIPPADVRAYYDDNPDEFTVEEQVRARHILLRVGDQRSDEEARSQLEAVRRRLEGGEDFGAVAQEVSGDPGSKDRGGELGFFGRGQMVPEFEEAAFSAQVGELVGPVRSAHGYHLIEVEERREGGLRPLPEVESQIRFRLQNERAAGVAESRIQELAGRIREEGITTGEGLRSLAEGSEELLFETTAAFARQEAVAGLGRSPEFSDTAFALEVGALSDPVKVPRGWAILRLAEIQEPRVPPLSEVEPQVRQALIREKQEELAVAHLQEARRRIEAGEPFEAVVAELDLEVQESGELGRGQSIEGLGASPAVTEAALEMEEGAVGGPVALPEGVVLFQVTERRRWDPAELAQQREPTRERLEQQELNRVLGSVIEERRRQADVTYNQALLESMGILGDGAET